MVILFFTLRSSRNFFGAGGGCMAEETREAFFYGERAMPFGSLFRSGERSCMNWSAFWDKWMDGQEGGGTLDLMKGWRHLLLHY